MVDIKIPQEYISFDYGFSGVDSPETLQPEIQAPPQFDPEINEKLDVLNEKIETLMQTITETKNTDNKTETQLRVDIRSLEAIIIPLLNNLLKTAEKDYIYWPNRASVIEKQLTKVLEITRG